VNTYTVEYYTKRYMTVTVEAEDEFDAQDVADDVVAWGREPTSSTHELSFTTSKDWQVNDVSQAAEVEPWCNHDAVAVVAGVCECGAKV